MARTLEDPTVEESKMGDGMMYSHPAYGQIGCSRVQGQTTLYGSDFIHHNYIVVRISRSVLERSLSRDWHYGRDEIIEVALSEAQWATFVSSMNMGSGVPCTIQREGHKLVPGIPYRTENSEYEKEAVQTVQDAIDKIDLVLEKGKLRKTEEAILRNARQELVSNLPFVEKQFAEHMEKTVEKAKVEVNAYATTTLMRMGLQNTHEVNKALETGGPVTMIEYADLDQEENIN